MIAKLDSHVIAQFVIEIQNIQAMVIESVYDLQKSLNVFTSQQIVPVSDIELQISTIFVSVSYFCKYLQD